MADVIPSQVPQAPSTIQSSQPRRGNQRGRGRGGRGRGRGAQNADAQTTSNNALLTNRKERTEKPVPEEGQHPIRIKTNFDEVFADERIEPSILGCIDASYILYDAVDAEFKKPFESSTQNVPLFSKQDFARFAILCSAKAYAELAKKVDNERTEFVDEAIFMDMMVPSMMPVLADHLGEVMHDGKCYRLDNAAEICSKLIFLSTLDHNAEITTGFLNSALNSVDYDPIADTFTFPGFDKATWLDYWEDEIKRRMCIALPSMTFTAANAATVQIKPTPADLPLAVGGNYVSDQASVQAIVAWYGTFQVQADAQAVLNAYITTLQTLESEYPWQALDAAITNTYGGRVIAGSLVRTRSSTFRKKTNVNIARFNTKIKLASTIGIDHKGSLAQLAWFKDGIGHSPFQLSTEEAGITLLVSLGNPFAGYEDRYIWNHRTDVEPEKLRWINSFLILPNKGGR